MEDLLPPTEEELGAAQPAFLQAIEETRRQLQAGDISLLDKCVLLCCSAQVCGSRSVLFLELDPDPHYCEKLDQAPATGRALLSLSPMDEGTIKTQNLNVIFTGVQ